MDIFLKPVSMPLWMFLIVALYGIVAHIYVTYRLAKELDNIFLKLRKFVSVVFMLPRPKKVKQNQGVNKEIYHTYDHINNPLRDIKNMENNPNDDSNKNTTDTPST
jgi:hypothetical protein